MIIGLMGFEFESENKGCEALSYSFLSMLSKGIVDSKIVIYNFTNCGMGYVSEHFPNMEFVIIPLRIRDLSFNMVKHMSRCDVIFDITMGDSFSDIYSKDVCLSDMRFKILAEIFSSKYVLLPQTYGPFYDKRVRRRATNILNKADAIFCRDALSAKYLKNICKIANPKIVTDVAFALSYDKNSVGVEHRQFNLGINVSGLLWKGGFTQNNQFGLMLDYQKYILALIDYFENTPGVSIHLIPHVINMENDAHDDDYKICAKIKQNYHNIYLAPTFKTPMEAKSYIANMDFFIGARMHSTVASLSAGIATIPVSYSRKFEGLFGNIGYNYVLSAQTVSTDEALKLTIQWIDHRDALKAEVEKAVEKTSIELSNFYQDLLSLFNDI